MMNQLQIRFILADAYFEALLKAVPKAKKRIVIHAMTLLWGTRTKELAPHLIAAASRGIEVRIVGDIYSKFQARRPQLVRSKISSWAQTQTINEQLRASGVHVTYVGKLGVNPFKTRCHSKIVLIDDFIYTFGGINFSDDSLENHDYMFEIHDAALATRLYNIVRDIEKDTGKPLPDIREELDVHTALLFDGGTIDESVIYETACDVVAAAKKVYYVSQMCPSGRLAELITATENECYFVRATQAEPPGPIDLIWNQLRYSITNRYKGKTYVHAKFILTEGHDGSKHLISGSNNFSWRGIRYGTKEIALHSNDPKLWDVLYGFLQNEIVAAD